MTIFEVQKCLSPINLGYFFFHFPLKVRYAVRFTEPLVLPNHRTWPNHWFCRTTEPNRKFGRTLVKRIGENGRRSILSIYQALQVHIDNCSSQIIRKVIFSSWLPKMSWMHLLGNHYYLHNAFCSSLWRYSSHHLCTKCHLSHKISLMAKSKHFQLT